ncbi:MAG: putative diguanylate cyclase AdrA [Candidatus Accumulibacter sp. SK-11]|nr:MAG: putative diguanylate cyclase AdrA [Candidatus Accumulibacter sp. SK-11]
MFKHDHLSQLHSSRLASRRLHRRPAIPGGHPSAHAQTSGAAAGSGTQHRRMRYGSMPAPQATILDLLAAEARIADLESALSKAQAAAVTDTLTGALNRRGFDQAYEREAARTRRKGGPLALALIDLDDFKRLNDTLGHQMGDQALIHLVRTLRSALRPSDILGRFGGEEFVLMLPDTGLDEAVTALTRFQRQLADCSLAGSDVALSFSAGVVVQAPGESLLQSIARADAATYAAKRAGKNCVLTG